ncbi:DUF202 domain-containing protein [Microbacterium sp.]|uniref:DUF202 domain-containing protein n=1 Tax=Microbacterium sp. TaxID=51671 RepID=UPI003A882DF5
MTSPRFDPGLQPERTELAWRRTALAFGLGSLVSLRLLPAVLNSAWWVIPGCCGIAVAVIVWVGAQRRLTRISRTLGAGESLKHESAIALTALAAVILMTALLAATAVLSVALSRAL